MEIGKLPKDFGQSTAFYRVWTGIQFPVSRIFQNLYTQILDFLPTKPKVRFFSFQTFFLFYCGFLLLNAPWYGLNGWDTFKPSIAGFTFPLSLGGILNTFLPFILLFFTFAEFSKYGKQLSIPAFFTEMRKKPTQKLLFILAVLWLVWNLLRTEFFDKYTWRSLNANLCLLAAFCILPVFVKSTLLGFRNVLATVSIFSGVLSIFIPLISPSTSEKSLGLSENTIRFIGFNMNQVTTVFSSTILLLVGFWLFLFSSREKENDQKTIEKSKIAPHFEKSSPLWGAFNFSISFVKKSQTLFAFLFFLFGILSVSLAASRAGMLSILFIACVIRFFPSKAWKPFQSKPELRMRLNIIVLAMVFGNLTPNMLEKYNFLNFHGSDAPVFSNKISKAVEDISKNPHTLRNLDLLINTNGRTFVLETLLDQSYLDSETVLFGKSTGFSSRVLQQPVHGVREPHNELLRAFFDHGLVGVLIFLGILFLLPFLFESQIIRISLTVVFLNILTENFFSYPALVVFPLFILLNLFDPLLKQREKEISASL